MPVKSSMPAKRPRGRPPKVWDTSGGPPIETKTDAYTEWPPPIPEGLNLNEQEQQFALALVECGGNRQLAFKTAFPGRCSALKPGSLQATAQRWCMKPQVQWWYRYLLNYRAERAGYSRDVAIQEADQAAKVAMDAGDMKAHVQAVGLKARLAGYITTKMEISLKRIEEMSVVELQTILGMDGHYQVPGVTAKHGEQPAPIPDYGEGLAPKTDDEKK